MANRKTPWTGGPLKAVLEPGAWTVCDERDEVLAFLSGDTPENAANSVLYAAAPEMAALIEEVFDLDDKNLKQAVGWGFRAETLLRRIYGLDEKGEGDE